MSSPKFFLLISMIGIHTFVLSGCLDAGSAETYIRVNQVGFEINDPKFAVVMSTDSRLKPGFMLVDSTGASVYTAELKRIPEELEGFPFSYSADFSNFTVAGVYSLAVGSESSPPFTIGQGLHRKSTRALLEFFKTQRCGPTEPRNHDPCHLADAAHLASEQLPDQKVDMTGGWHDAADYTKFLNTTAYAAYLMLLAYELRPNAFEDGDSNGTVDALEEARIGLDWCMKAHFQADRLIIQVQNQKDHSVGLRLPEHDPLAPERPAYDRPSRAHCGIAAAALALGCSVYKKTGDFSYGDRCLQHAIELFRLASGELPEFTSGPDSVYVDRSAWDNLTLAGAELYRATGDTAWLEAARRELDGHDVVHWVSWGDVGGLARARLAPYEPACLDSLSAALSFFKQKADQEAFGYPLDNYPWGSAGLQMGIAMLAVLHHNLTGSGDYLSLVYQQRDFILGKNRLGVSFIVGLGSDYPRQLHHQVSYLKDIPLRGALAGGYIDASAFKSSGIILQGPDRLAALQSNSSVYHDDFNDFLCNEPSISNNAQALLLFAWLCSDSD